MSKGKRIWPKRDEFMEAQTPNQLLLFDMKEVITCGKSYKDYVRRQNEIYERETRLWKKHDPAAL